MNFRDHSSVENMAKSYLDWWHEAGVDVATAPEAHNWLEDLSNAAQPIAAVANDAPIKPASPKSLAQNGQEAVSLRESITSTSEWPADIESLVGAIRDKRPLPGNHFGGKMAIPSLSLGPALLLIGDMPEMLDIENGQMPSGQVGELVQRMMQAIGVAAESYCFTALATTRPATGALPDGDLPMLGQFMEHQIGLIKPEKVVIFGSAACQALLGADVMDKRGNLHYFNHNVHKVAAVTTFHPRTLLARPQMKGQAWRDLQVLMK